MVALTGGIGSGKSRVAALFAERGVPVLDTDVLARELVEPGQPALAAIVERFGEAVLDADGRLDRRRLRERVFADESARRDLEAILHPRIRETVRQRIRTLDAPYCLVVVPLLVETGGYDWVDRVLLVDAPATVRERRVIERDAVDAGQVRRIMAAQATDEARRARADDRIDNTGDLSALEERVNDLHDRYRALAASA